LAYIAISSNVFAFGDTRQEAIKGCLGYLSSDKCYPIETYAYLEHVQKLKIRHDDGGIQWVKAAAFDVKASRQVVSQRGRG
jgi:hypothetical protein